jgi:hypothetical protein
MKRGVIFVLLAAAGLAGCAAVAPPAARYFDRLDPYNGATAFAYAAAAGQWEPARAWIVPDQQPRFPVEAFPAALEEPVAGGSATLLEVLREGIVIRPFGGKPTATLAQVPILYKLPGGGPRFLVGSIRLERESEEAAKAAGREDEPVWYVDLEGTVAAAKKLAPRSLESLVSEKNDRLREAAIGAAGLKVETP